jgi:hypothetical protein
VTVKRERTGDDLLPPPSAVSASFALFVGESVLALLNAVIQVSAHFNGPVAVVGAAIEASLLIGLGIQMRAGKLWARVTLMSVAGLFVVIGVLSVIALRGAFGHRMDGLVLFALICVTVKLALIVAGVVMMYRPSTYGYFH